MFYRRNLFDEIFKVFSNSEFESMFDNRNTTFTKIGDNGFIMRYTSGPMFETNDTDEVINLKQQLEECVEKQDFEKAVEIRDRIKVLEENGEKLHELETKLQKAISKQDFEEAIKLRDEIKSLKS
jgi:excinuclease UvrABC helicase subunit UvrB